MQLVHATGKTWYKVLYQHTMYVISLSNISIKTNFKQITRVELILVQYSEGDYILCMTSRYFFRSFTNVRLLCFVSHSNGMTSCQSRERLVQRRAILLSPQCGDTTSCIRHLVPDRRLSLISKENVYNLDNIWLFLFFAIFIFFILCVIVSLSVIHIINNILCD